jgi:hypothetical protein
MKAGYTAAIGLIAGDLPRDTSKLVFVIPAVPSAEELNCLP